MTKQIPLTQNKFALVSDEDFEYLSQYKWAAFFNGRKWYAVRHSSRRLGRRRTIYMHRVITNVSNDLEVDHINGDGLDNRRENLRIATRWQNAANRGTDKTNTSGFKGVWWDSHAKKWAATVHIKNERIYLGLFNSAEDAARAYDTESRKHLGEYAYPNFRQEGR